MSHHVKEKLKQCALNAYLKGFALQTAAHVMRNMLIAHAEAYKAIKEMPGTSLWHIC